MAASSGELNAYHPEKTGGVHAIFGEPALLHGLLATGAEAILSSYRWLEKPGQVTVRISAHRDRPFRHRDRAFRTIVTAHFGAS